MVTINDLDVKDRFIYDVLSAQHFHRVNWYDPATNPLEKAAELYWNTVTRDGTMYLGDINFPDIRWFEGWFSWPFIYFDSMIIHTMFKDDYCVENRRTIENVGGEGPYMTENCYVKRGDIVIDAGAYIGDWSAVASVMGGDVYAFDPCTRFNRLLNDVANRNGFKVVNAGLGDVTTSEVLHQYEPGSESFCTRDKQSNDEIVSIVRLDDYVRENSLKHVDFIKADIEGFENQMLMGARNTIKTFHPSLSIRTYHAPGDKELLTKTILSICNDYRIEYGTKTLYAYIE